MLPPTGHHGKMKHIKGPVVSVQTLKNFKIMLDKFCDQVTYSHSDKATLFGCKQTKTHFELWSKSFISNHFMYMMLVFGQRGTVRWCVETQHVVQ